ncbi:hypothetical protein BDZ94DRAFT_1307103 [Collybia nuda]|uniref:Uncharacterized protein n=1 Tax=Collybia nuda TaxID=64659 RepID=A0A9P6CM98_9AGAR|nr:hypothetical protein BDZ94DRAFT_1307103 [Collybia nuda]
MDNFSAAQPEIFHLGDIVKIQVSFVVVPLKGDHHKMITVLQSIALLDGTFGQSASKNKQVPYKASAMWELEAKSAKRGQIVTVSPFGLYLFTIFLSLLTIVSRIVQSSDYLFFPYLLIPHFVLINSIITFIFHIVTQRHIYTYQ